MPVPTLPPRGLRRAAAVAALLILAANPVADALRLKYWTQGFGPRKLFALQEAGWRPDVLILGSSRMEAALVGQRLESDLTAALGRPLAVFNAAQAATGASEPAWILRDLVASNGCPAAVVLEVHLEGLNARSGRLERSLEVYPSLADLPFALPHVLLAPAQLDALLGSPFRGFGNFARRLARSPEERGRAAFRKSLLERRGSRYDATGALIARSGAGPEPTLAARPAWRRAREAEERRDFLVSEHRLDRFRLGGLPAANLERLARQTARCGAALLLVKLPTRYTLAAWGFGDEEATAERFLAGFASRHGAAYLDLGRALAPLADEEFFDLSHLSFAGAVRASQAMVPALAAALRGPRERE